MVRRGLVTVGVLVLLGLQPVPVMAQTDGTLAYHLLRDDPGQDDTTQISLAWSRLAYADDAPEGPATALLGRDDLFADNLAAGSLQGQDDNGRPLLLNDSDELEPEVLAELLRLGVEHVQILGGPDAVSQSVFDALEAEGFSVQRLFGATRTETAIEIAESEFPDATEAFLARSSAEGDDPTQAFADSLAGGAWAAALGVPVLFTTTSSLTGTTAEFLADSQIQRVTILGGLAAVSAEVEEELEDLGIEVERIDGATRFDTAVLIAIARGFDSHDESDVSLLVDGQLGTAWADGFAAAVLSARGFPVLLANAAAEGGLPPETAAYFGASTTRQAGVLDDVDLVCGGTTSDDACTTAAESDGLTVTPFPPPAPTTNATITVTPTVLDALGFVANPDTDPADDREYTAEDLEGDSYAISVVTTDRFTVDGDGVYRFANTTDTRCPDSRIVRPNAAAWVTSVNGQPLGSQAGPLASGFTPIDGTLTFTIDAGGVETFAPVVHEDTTTCPALETDTDGLPTEEFGVGGAVVSSLPEAGAGYQEFDVIAAAPAIDRLTGDPDPPFDGDPDDDTAVRESFYDYDANDRLEVASADCIRPQVVGLAVFEAEASVGDVVLVDYQPDPTLSSTFRLCDIVPGQPALSVSSTALNQVILAVAPNTPQLSAFGAADAIVLERFDPAETSCAAGPGIAGNGPVVAVGTFHASDDQEPDDHGRVRLHGDERPELPRGLSRLVLPGPRRGRR